MKKCYEVKGKSAEDVLEDMTYREVNFDSPEYLEIQKAAIQVKISDRICKTIDDLRRSNNRTSIALNALTGVLVLVGLLQLYLAYYSN